MNDRVRKICELRHNELAVQCIDSNCGGVNEYEIGFHTKMYFCKTHGWKENIAFKGA